MPVNAQIMERLLIDRALGALSADVEALVEDYVKREPGAEALAQEIDGTVALARDAFPPSDDVSILPRLALHRKRGTGARILSWALSLAACLLIGLAVGAWLTGPEATTPPSAQSHGARVQSRAPMPVSSDAEPLGFWSARRLHRQASTGREGRSRRVIWDSPAKSPRVEEVS